MTDTDRDLRAAIIAVTRSLDEAGLVPNKSGNVSCRSSGGFLITPAGVPYAELVPEQIVELSPDGSPDPAGARPSSEWRMHEAIYALRPDAEAIVHTHSPHATALACAGRGIPAFHYMIALAGGDIRCMPYATFGTANSPSPPCGASRTGGRLCSRTTASLHSVPHCAMPTPWRARSRTWRGSTSCCWRPALEPVLLGEEELARVMDKFGDYGRLKRG
jgi:L-fuculose-phosphate aldolase